MQIAPIARPGFPKYDQRRRLSAGSIKQRLEEDEKKEREDTVQINQQPNLISLFQHLVAQLE